MPAGLRRPLLRNMLVLALCWAGAAALATCTIADAEETRAPPVAGGDPERGRQAIYAYGCIACHVVPGVRSHGGVESQVGPPLRQFATRSYIGGVVPNTPENLILWLQDPPAIQPTTAMPNVGVTAEDALHMTAYLFTLR